MRQWSRFKCRTTTCHTSATHLISHHCRCRRRRRRVAAATTGCWLVVVVAGTKGRGVVRGAGAAHTCNKAGVKRVEPGPGRQGAHEFSHISKDNRGTIECVAARAARGLRGNGNQWVKPAGPIRYPSNITPSPLPTKTKKRGVCWGAFECGDSVLPGNKQQISVFFSAFAPPVMGEWDPT